MARQDAIKAPFNEFLKSLPHIETKIQDDNSVAHGKLVFRMKPLQPLAERRMYIKSFKVARPRLSSIPCIPSVPSCSKMRRRRCWPHGRV